MNDQLSKFDPQLEGIVNRLVTNLKGLLEDDSDKVKENLIVNERNYILNFYVFMLFLFLGSPGAFLRAFSWNKMKYRVDEPISNIMNNIVEEVNQVDHVIKNKIGSYHHTKSQLNSLNRKKT